MSEDPAQRLLATMRFAASAPQSLSVNDLADHACYSPAHFARAFTTTMGIGPGQYLTALRIAESKRLLLAHADPVIDVAIAAGFDSLSSFARRFRDSVGVPPAQFRRLADTLGERPVSPFALQASGTGHVLVSVSLPAGFSPHGDPSVWIGWYPRRVPIGLPHAGVLMRGRTSVALALCPSAPFLLAFAAPADADPYEQLVPKSPLVCGYPMALTAPCAVRLAFDTPSLDHPFPLLSALPSLADRLADR